MKPLASIALVALALAGLFLFVRSWGPGGGAVALLPEVAVDTPAAQAGADAELQPEVLEAQAEAEPTPWHVTTREDVGRTEVVRRVRVKALVLSESSIHGKRLGGVPVEFGVAFRNGWDRPLEGQLVLGHGVSDASGHVEVELAVPVGLARPYARLVVFGRPKGLGYQQRDGAMPLAEEGDVDLELTVIASMGGTVSGRVVDADGVPLAVRVNLVKSEPGETLNSPLYRRLGEPPFGASRDRSNAEGEFRLHYGEAGRFRVLAVARELGMGLSEVLELDAGQSVEGLVIRLEGPGRLAGRVVDLEGQPVAGLALQALLVGAGGEEPSGGGFPSVQGETDGEGRFEFTALRAGRFEMRATRREDSDRIWDAPEYTWLLAPSPVSSLGGELELVFGEMQLVLKTQDDMGRLMHPGVGLLGRLKSRDVRAYLVPCSPAGRRVAVDASNVPIGRFRKDRSVRFAIRTDGDYLVGVASLEMGVHEEVVHIGSEGMRTTRTVFLGPAAEPGTLRIRLVDGEGRKFEGGNRVVVQVPRSGTALFTSKWASTESEYEVQLPAGEYDASAKRLETLNLLDMTVGPEQASPGMQRAQVRSGEVTELTMVVSVAKE